MKKCILPNTLQRYNLLCPHTIVWASFLMYLLISLTYIKGNYSAIDVVANDIFRR